MLSQSHSRKMFFYSLLPIALSSLHFDLFKQSQNNCINFFVLESHFKSVIFSFAFCRFSFFAVQTKISIKAGWCFMKVLVETGWNCYLKITYCNLSIFIFICVGYFVSLYLWKERNLNKENLLHQRCYLKEINFCVDLFSRTNFFSISRGYIFVDGPT